MTSFTFSAEQISSAPREARRWMENEIAKALGLQAPEHDPLGMQAGAIAACTIDEAAQIFNLISGNFLVTQVFSSWRAKHPSRKAYRRSMASTSATRATPRRASTRGMSQRDHPRLAKGSKRPDSLAVRARRKGAYYIHEPTYRNIRMLREHLLSPHSSTARTQPSEPDAEASEPVMQPEHAFARPPRDRARSQPSTTAQLNWRPRSDVIQ